MAIFSSLFPAKFGHDRNGKDTTSQVDDTSLRRQRRRRRTNRHNNSGHKW